MEGRLQDSHARLVNVLAAFDEAAVGGLELTEFIEQIDRMADPAHELTAEELAVTVDQHDAGDPFASEDGSAQSIESGYS